MVGRAEQLLHAVFHFQPSGLADLDQTQHGGVGEDVDDLGRGIGHEWNSSLNNSFDLSNDPSSMGCIYSQALSKTSSPVSSAIFYLFFLTLPFKGHSRKHPAAGAE